MLTKTSQHQRHPFMVESPGAIRDKQKITTLYQRINKYCDSTFSSPLSRIESWAVYGIGSCGIAATLLFYSIKLGLFNNLKNFGQSVVAGTGIGIMIGVTSFSVGLGLSGLTEYALNALEGKGKKKSIISNSSATSKATSKPKSSFKAGTTSLSQKWSIKPATKNKIAGMSTCVILYCAIAALIGYTLLKNGTSVKLIPNITGVLTSLGLGIGIGVLSLIPSLSIGLTIEHLLNERDARKKLMSLEV